MHDDVFQIQLDIAYRSYFRPYIVTRLNKMLNYSNPSTSCYSVHHVPENIHWGMPGGGIDDMSEYYCVNNKPVKLWIIGEVIKSWFRDQEGYNPRQVSITVQPLVHSDFMKLNTWLSREGVPPPSKLFILLARSSSIFAISQKLKMPPVFEPSVQCLASIRLTIW